MSPKLLPLHSHPFEYISKQVTERHERPIRAERYEDRRAIGEGRKDAQLENTEAMDRKFLEETAMLNLQARPKVVEPEFSAAVFNMIAV